MNDPMCTPVFYLVIPAYNPGAVVLNVVADALPFVDKLILVNDGCDAENLALLQQCARHPHVELLHHAQNQGKGQALYTGFHWCLESMRDSDFILCMDSDGQHLARDIPRFQDLARRENGLNFAMGERREDERMPWKSRLGNAAMRTLFRLQYGGDVHDTQTGFRLLSPAFARKCMARIAPGRYETEMRMLILAVRSFGHIPSVTIDTLYFADNRNSKFRPLRDSYQVMRLFLDYLLISALSFALDYLLFVALVAFLGVGYLWANALARTCSVAFNFTAHKRYTFDHCASWSTGVLRYIVVALNTLLLSSALLHFFVHWGGMNQLTVKPVVDVLAFVLNFFLLSRLVFREYHPAAT